MGVSTKPEKNLLIRGIYKNHPRVTCVRAPRQAEHDACIVNFYPVADARIDGRTGRLGVHQDKVGTARSDYSSGEVQRCGITSRVQ